MERTLAAININLGEAPQTVRTFWTREKYIDLA
jgi:hypothetical protein